MGEKEVSKDSQEEPNPMCLSRSQPSELPHPVSRELPAFYSHRVTTGGHRGLSGDSRSDGAGPRVTQTFQEELKSTLPTRLCHLGV